MLSKILYARLGRLFPHLVDARALARLRAFLRALLRAFYMRFYTLVCIQLIMLSLTIPGGHPPGPPVSPAVGFSSRSHVMRLARGIADATNLVRPDWAALRQQISIVAFWANLGVLN